MQMEQVGQRRTAQEVIALVPIRILKTELLRLFPAEPPHLRTESTAGRPTVPEQPTALAAALAAKFGAKKTPTHRGWRFTKSD